MCVCINYCICIFFGYIYIYICVWCIYHKLPSLELQTNLANYGAPPCNNQQVRIHQRKRNGNLPEIWIFRLAGCILTGQGANFGYVNWEFYFVDMWLAVEHVVSGAKKIKPPASLIRLTMVDLWTLSKNQGFPTSWLHVPSGYLT